MRTPHGAHLARTHGRTGRLVRALVALLALVTVLPLASLAALSSPSYAAPHHARRLTTIDGWTSAATTAPTGGAYVVHVTVPGGRRPVRLERRVGSSWRPVDRVSSAPSGRATLTWNTPDRAATVTLRVHAPRAASRRAAVTPARSVRVVSTGATGGTGGVAGAVTATVTGTVTSTVTVVLSPALREVLRLVNVVRSTGHTCGGTRYPAARPLRANTRLNRAAVKFARLLGGRGFFAHESPDGSGPGDRITAEGYRWRAYGENIAAGYTTPASVVQGWLDSPGHCVNLMNATYTEIGLGYAYTAGSPYGHYWVQDFARPM